MAELSPWRRARERFENWIFGPPGEEPAVPFRRVLLDELRLIRAKRERARGEPPATKLPDLQASVTISAEMGTFEQIEGDRIPEHLFDRPAFKEALSENLTGVAFSGGGIRSATFNLGMLQALCDLRLLGRFDYLSTVSGGGYIGSWLTALIDRENRRQPGPDEPKMAIDRVQRRLQTRREPGQPVEDPSIHFLRQHSNFLTPKVGILTADTWAMVANYLRNVLLNLLVLIPGLAIFLLLPRLAVLAGDQMDWVDENVGKWLTVLVPLELPVASILISILLGMCATIVTGYNMASLAAVERSRQERAETREDRRGIPWLQLGRIQRFLVIPLLIAAFLASQRLADSGGDPLLWAGAVALLWFLSWALAWAVAMRSRWREHQARVQWLLILLWSLPSGAAAGFLLKQIANLLGTFESSWALYTWGAPMVLLWFVLLGVLQTGLMGREMRDRQREWLNRLGAWLLIYLLAWAGLFGIVVYGPVLLSALRGWTQVAFACGWVGATLGGLLAGRGLSLGESKEGNLPRRLLAALAPYVFVFGLVALLAVGLDWTASAYFDGGKSWDAFVGRRAELAQAAEFAARAEEAGAAPAVGVSWLSSLFAAHEGLLRSTSDHPIKTLVLFFGMGVAALLFAWRVDVNDFSMHRFYRNRLVRAYLGASVDPPEDPTLRERRRQPFTGFYQGDDVPLRGTWDPEDGDGILLGEPGPLPIVNTALNLVAGDELAWQQRKAASFVLTPLYCGFDTRGQEVDPELDPKIERYGYRRAERYGNRPATLTLGSAFAISGAAASPNMGFRTTPAFAFLLTVFNVRLGWWLGNPRHQRAWARSGPVFSLAPLLMEVFGKTRGRTRYVYLSDGGHFENLGLYELVRRRTRYIVAFDSGADPELNFEDVGNAIRKCRADLGVEIDLDLNCIRRGENTLSPWHCAIGSIDYGGDQRGLLLYVKASLTGTEPEDVRNYARCNPTFPHQTTADQFFDESQFESYRRLGHHIGMTVLARAVDSASEWLRVPRPGARGQTRAVEVVSLERLWLALEQRWVRPSRAAIGAFGRNSRALDGLFERLRKTPELAFLDGQIYPEWRRFLSGVEETEEELPSTAILALPPSVEERRQGFYFCNSLIQLMENVYLDLELDHDVDHPDNRGWMNLFKHWSWSGMFRAAWTISAATYGRRFQTFCAERLDLGLGVVDATPLEAPSPLDRAAFENAVENLDPTFLNFLEREQIALFLDYAEVPVARVDQLELVVPGHGDDGAAPELLRFGFGYVLRDPNGRVLLFRVQDHLRTMGLARRGLRHLAASAKDEIESEALLGSDRKLRRGFRAVLERMAADCSGDALEGTERAACERFRAEFSGGEKRFGELLRSVRREWRAVSELRIHGTCHGVVTREATS